MAVLVPVVVPLAKCRIVLMIVTSLGPLHSMTIVLFSGSSSGPLLHSAVQVRVTSDPTGWTGLTRSLVMVTETGAGTGRRKYNNMQYLKYSKHIESYW